MSAEVGGSTGSNEPAPDPAAPGALTRRQRRRIRGLAEATRTPLPDMAAMTHPQAARWIQEADARHRRISLGQRDEL